MSPVAVATLSFVLAAQLLFGAADASPALEQSRSLAPQASPCGTALNTSACSGSGQLSVRVSDRSSDSAGSASTGDPALHVLGCGAASAGALAGLHDANAAEDAHLCDAVAPQCEAQDTQSTGAAISVRQRPNGTAALDGIACTTPAQPQVTADLVRGRVVRLIPTAGLGLAPTDSTLVNIQTITWVDAPHQQTLPAITLLGRQVSITLALAHVTWDFGDQHTAATTSPGTRYDPTSHPCRTRQCPGYYGHTYREPGTDTLHATATWTATFTVDDGAAITIPGTIDGPTATTTLTVKEARSVLVPDGH